MEEYVQSNKILMRAINFVQDEQLYNSPEIAGTLIAYYRYAIQSSSMTREDLKIFFLNLMRQKKISSNIQEKELQQIFKQDYKNIESKAVKLLADEIMRSLRLKINSNNREFRKDQQQLSEKAKNTLAIFFKINYEYCTLTTGSVRDLITVSDLAKIYQYLPAKIIQIKDIFMKYKDNIVIKPCSEYRKFIYTIAILKVKVLILHCLQFQPYPPQSLIQASYFRQSFINSGTKQQKNTKIMLTLADYCKNRLEMNQMKTKQKQNLRRQLKRIAKSKLTPEQINLEVEQAADKYFVDREIVKKQFRRIKFHISNLMEKQPNRKIQVLSLFNYYRYKYHFEGAKQTGQYIQQQWPYRVKSFLQFNCDKQLSLIGDQQQANCSQIATKLIQIHTKNNEEVLYIDHSEFYHRQFHLYNQLINEKPTMNRYEPFEPMKDCIFTLITGLMNSKVMFYLTVKPPFRLFYYFQKIIEVLDKIKDKLPRIIALYIPPILNKDQLSSLSKLIEYLDSVEKKLYLLPKKHDSNLNQRVTSVLKIKVERQLSSYINNRHFQQMLKNKVHQALLSIDLQEQFKQISQQIQKNIKQKETFFIIQKANQDENEGKQENAKQKLYGIEPLIFQTFNLTKKSKENICLYSRYSLIRKQDINDELIVLNDVSDQKISIAITEEMKLSYEQFKKNSKKVQSVLMNQLFNFAKANQRKYDYEENRLHILGNIKENKASFKKSIFYHAFSVYFLNKYLLFARNSILQSGNAQQVLDFVNKKQKEIRIKNRTDMVPPEDKLEGFINKFDEDIKLRIYLRQQLRPLLFWDCLTEFKIIQKFERPGKRRQSTGRKKIKE